jgi:choline dehydrogenase
MMEMPDSSSMAVPQAKLMGGGSSINGGTALRSTRVDSDEWVEMGNDAGDFDCVYQVYQSLKNDPVRGTRRPHPIIRASA